MNETSLLNNIFRLRAKKIDKFATDAEAIQHKVLMNLVQKASDTEWGYKHNYSAIRGYEDFASNVAVQDYESLKGVVNQVGNAFALFENTEVNWTFAVVRVHTYGRCVDYVVSVAVLGDVLIVIGFTSA